MNNNYIISIADGRFFGGWDHFGDMIIRKPDERKFSYRMSRTVAASNLAKVESFTHQKCVVESV